MLREAPELEAKALFEYLAQSHPGGIKAGLLRTFQRRVRAWRLAEGPEKEVFFTQEHKPGEVLAVDWTDMGELGITIEGKVLAHKLFHAVLPYSNWEWAVRAHSESTLSLRGGLKATLGRLGRVPRQLAHRPFLDGDPPVEDATARSVASTRSIWGFARITASSRARSTWARPQENGDCESAHGHLKRRIRQHLLLRGSRDFASEEEYDRFLIGVLESANRLRDGASGRGTGGDEGDGRLRICPITGS